MKALNKQERNSAILKFSLWLFFCVVIICGSIIISAFVSSEQKKLSAQANENLMEELNFEKEYIAVKIQEIMDLMDMRESDEINNDSFNAELKNILSDISNETEEDLSWRGDMYRNIISISDYMIVAGKIVSTSGDKTDKQLKEVNKIIIEMESCLEDLIDLADQKKKKDIYAGLDEVEEQLLRALKMLKNYRDGVK